MIPRGAAAAAWCTTVATVAVPFGYIVGGWLVLASPYDPIANLVFLLGPALIPLGFALILPILALVFPRGDLPSPTWRLPSGLAGVLLGGATLLALLQPGEIAGTVSRNPIGLESMPDWVANLGNLATGLSILAVTLLGVMAVITRYRRGSTLERQQLRWFTAAAVFQPVRRRVQRVVDSRFDRARYDAEQIVGAFAGRLRDETNLQLLSAEMARVAGQTVRPLSSRLWLRTVTGRDIRKVS